MTAASYDVERIRSHFPALREGAAHFDGPGGSQTPDVVARAVAHTLTSAISNRGTVTPAERRADAIVAAARAAMGDLLAVDPQGVVFGRSATELTFHLARTLARSWGPGDEVVVSRLDHDANIRPWVIAAEAVGATVRWAEFDTATGELTPEAVESVVTDRTRLVAVTAASNLIGTRPDLPAIAAVAHDLRRPPLGRRRACDRPRAHRRARERRRLLGVLALQVPRPAPRGARREPGPARDAAPGQAAALERRRARALRARHAALRAARRLQAAVDFLADLGCSQRGFRRDRLVASFAALEDHEDALLATLEERLRAIPGLTAYSLAKRRTPTLLVTVEGTTRRRCARGSPSAASTLPPAHFYAWECSHHLGLGATGGLRMGLAPYTTASDIDRLARGLEQLCGTSR